MTGAATTGAGIGSSVLPDRAVVGIGGLDARAFLDNLVTNDLEGLAPGRALLAGLLSPQGKILFDFLVVDSGEAGLLLDVAADRAGDLVKRLSLYKLRSKVEIAVRGDLSVWLGPVADAIAYADPRSPKLPARAITAAPPAADQAAIATYEAERIAAGVPEGGRDYAWGDTFPHDALYDVIGGVSFTKGCYVGQEIVSRMKHRGTARRRIVRVSTEGTLPASGTELTAGETPVGEMGTSAGRIGLAMLRLDRLAEAAAKGQTLISGGGATMKADAGDIVRLAPPARPAPA